jgi:putative ABC transport system permease protein
MGFWLRLALLFAPREFRRHYGEEIAASERDVRFSDVVDVAITGLRLRIDDFTRDAAYALRRLAKAPLLVAIVGFTFALGIGANVAVFSVLNAVVLKPLPYLDAANLVTIRAFDSRRQSPPALSIPDIMDLRAQSHSLAAIAAVAQDQITVQSENRPVSLTGISVMPEYFSILGIRPQLGRVLTPADSRPGVNNIVISDAVWRKDFSTDPSVVGRALMIGGASTRIVGVLAPGQLLVNPNTQAPLDPQDYLSALPETATPHERGSRYLGAIARLAPGASIDGANAELALISSRLKKLYPGYNKAFSFSVQSLRASVLGSTSLIVWTVFGAVVGILLIACANVGNLLGARWSARDREFALRRSLGATSSSIARLLVIETGMLALLGAVVGVGLAYVVLQTVARYALSALPRAGNVAIDGATLLYALAIVIATTLLAALVPILSLNVSDLNATLKAAGRGGDASARHGARAVLVVFEIAIALALVTVSGLMVRGFIELSHTPLGIRPAGVVMSDLVSLPNGPFATLDARLAAQNHLLAALRALPGVDAASLTVAYPLSGISLNFDTSVLGKHYPEGLEPSAAGNDVSPGYFRALGIPILRGRDITDDDTAQAPPVVVINQSFAQTILSGRGPLGAQIRIAGWNGTKAHWATVVGVVADTRSRLSEPPVAGYYVPLDQAPPMFFSAIVHAPNLDPATVGREMQGAFSNVLPTIQAPQTSTVAGLVAWETRGIRTTAVLLGILSILALLIALAGIFGVVSFSVTQRSREFGVRAALGATARAIVADVLRRTLTTTAIGVAFGVVLAAIAARAVGPQLGAISPFDPATFLTVVVLIFLASGLASMHPALRATRVQPVDALRYE